MNRHNKEYYDARKLMEGIPKVCVNCGATEDIDMHHIVPLSQGGGNHLGNIVYLCRRCHYKAHDAKIGRYAGERSGRPKNKKPVNADSVISRYIRAEIKSKEARKLLGIEGGMKLTDQWYYRDYLERTGVVKLERIANKKESISKITDSTGKTYTYVDGELVDVKTN